MYTNNFCLGYTAVSCFFEIFPTPGGWVVGKFDFNENSVVSLDLDLDCGLRLRVCQNKNSNPMIEYLSYIARLILN